MPKTNDNLTLTPALALAKEARTMSKNDEFTIPWAGVPDEELTAEDLEFLEGMLDSDLMAWCPHSPEELQEWRSWQAEEDAEEAEKLKSAGAKKT